MFKATRATYFLLLFALIGMANAFYVSYASYTHHLLWCPAPIEGCNVVVNSPYAHFFDMPLGYYGLIFYSYMFALAIFLVFDPFSRSLRLGTVIYAALGLSCSIYFEYVQVEFVPQFCIYCLVSATLTFLLLVAAIMHFKMTSRWATIHWFSSNKGEAMHS